MSPNILLTALAGLFAADGMHYGKDVPTPLHDELNPPKGRQKFFRALQRDGLLEQFRSAKLAPDIIDKYIKENFSQQDLERMSKAAAKQQRKLNAKTISSR